MALQLAEGAASIASDPSQLLGIVGLVVSCVAATAAAASALIAWRFHRRLVATEEERRALAEQCMKPLPLVCQAAGVLHTEHRTVRVAAHFFNPGEVPISLHRPALYLRAPATSLDDLICIGQLDYLNDGTLSVGPLLLGPHELVHARLCSELLTERRIRELCYDLSDLPSGPYAETRVRSCLAVTGEWPGGKQFGPVVIHDVWLSLSYYAPPTVRGRIWDLPDGMRLGDPGP